MGRGVSWAFVVALMGVFATAPAVAADVEFSSDVHNGYVLDGHSGSTVQIDSGVTLDNTAFNFDCPVTSTSFNASALCATTSAWMVTNNGTIGNGGVYFIAGGGVDNYGSISSSNAIWIERGYATVINEANATTTGALVIGNFNSPAQATGGSVENWGTMTSSYQTVGIAGNGIVTNHEGALIKGGAGGNAVTFVIGTSHVVVNDGTIQSNDTGYGTGVAADYGDITNNSTGKILGAYNGVWANGGGATAVKNYGFIEASKAQGGGSAIEFDAGGSLVNTGTIRSFTSNSTSSDAGISFSGAGSITNSGAIESTDGGKAIVFNGSGAHTLTLQTGSALGGAVQGGSGTDALVLQGTGSETLNRFTGFETLDMQGSHWTLSDAGSFTGGTTIDAGTLSVDGTLTTSALSVLTGGVLGGNGTVAGAVTVASGGKIAPGNSIGTLTAASATYQADSTFEVEVDPSSADELIVSATATIDPTANVSVLAAPGTYTDGQRYLILDALTRNGAFASTVVDNSAFLAFTLDQSIANQVWLQVATVADFVDVAETPNQRAAAGGLQELGPGNDLFDAIAMLDVDAARHAFDLSSGEIHPTAAGVLLDDSRFVREAILDRLTERFDEDFASAPALGYADGPVTDSTAAAFASPPSIKAWGQGFGSWARSDGNGNAAAFDRSVGGFIAGVDAQPEGAWRFGAAFGYESASISVPDRSSTASVGEYDLVAYGATQAGPVALRLGGAVAFQTLDTTRADSFSGFDETLKAQYGAETGQLFGEAAYHMALGGLALDPFAGLAYVDTSSDGFTERGGLAALSGASASEGMTLASFGARFGTALPVASGSMKLTGVVAWQHAFGDVTPVSELAFEGGTPFSISGTPIARDALRLEAGIDWKLSRRASLSVNYSGQIASGADDHGANVRLTIGF